MPFGNLRRKPSSKDVRRQSFLQTEAPAYNDPPPPSTAPGPKSNSSDLLRPASAAAARPSSRHANSETTCPSLPSRPSSRLSSSRRSFKARYASDSHLKRSYHEHAGNPPPSPLHRTPHLAYGLTYCSLAPTIGLTSASRADFDKDMPRKRKFRPFVNTNPFRASSYQGDDRKPCNSMNLQATPTTRTQGTTLNNRPSTSTVGTDHGGYALYNNHIEFLAPRHSESSTHMRTSGDRSPAYFEPVSRKPSFFNFKRKKPEPLFPLPVRVSPPKAASTASSSSPIQRYSSVDLPSRAQAGNGQSDSPTTTYSIGPPKLHRHGSSGSVRSVHSSPPLTRPPGISARSRSGTMSSFPSRQDSERGPMPHVQSSGRNSNSTTLGRNSIVGIRSLTLRLRNPSDPYVSRISTPGSGRPRVSGNNSFALSRETLVVPQREEGETSGKYYSRLEKDYPKRNIALALSKSSDAFSHDALRSLARTFKFYEEPVDMSLRKFLWEVPLTGEAQQIDRVITAFSERYHECNPHIFSTADETNLVSFSLIILHSDLFNPSVKNKMQRTQYQNNTRDVGIPNEILGYFYDNIAYTEFISADADEDDGERKSKSAYRKARKVKQKLADPHAQKNDKQDPYEVILDPKMKIDNLRPALREELSFEDSYTYMGTANRFEIPSLRASFARFGVLQIVSARSRPEAFSSPTTIDNPSESQAGVVNIKVAKIGVVWRKSPKRKKTRSPWQEWGAILTPSQLFLCKNINWVKGLMQQAESHQKHGNRHTAVVFKPALTEFAFDSKVATNDAVALQDTNYRRHKHAFVLARRPNVEGMSQEQYFEETLLADNETEMNDWIAKINYASTFRSTNIRLHSWSVAVRRQQSNETHASVKSIVSKNNFTEENLRASTEMLARTQAAKIKLAAAEDEVGRKIKKLDDNIRTARHLEILAPFMPKTRGELLAFGAKLAHNIRWARFDVARLKCQRDILFRDTQEDESLTTTPGKKNELDRPRDRLSSQLKNVPVDSSDKIVEQSIHVDTQPSYEKGDLIDSIDEAFATPPEIMEDFDARQSTGQLKLLPIDNLEDTKALSATPLARRNSSPTNIEKLRPQSAGSALTTQSVPDGRPSTTTAPDSEIETIAPPSFFSSPDSRNTKVRRSLQRTLRDPHSHTSQSSRGSRTSRRPHRDSRHDDEDGTNISITSSADAEALARRPGHGSFKVHGKKASVITLGGEWQNVPAEERLRLKKMALSHDGEQREGVRNSYVGGASIAEAEEASPLDGVTSRDLDGVVFTQAEDVRDNDDGEGLGGNRYAHAGQEQDATTTDTDATPREEHFVIATEERREDKSDKRVVIADDEADHNRTA